MNRKLLTTLAICLGLLTSMVAQAHWFMPKHNMKIPVKKGRYLVKTGIDEVTFNKVIDRVEGFYVPIFAEKGLKLQIERRWSDGTINAYAQRIGSIAKVSMFGGLARHQEVTADGFALVVCHEVGHHLGGAPRKGDRWAANEGQSDYWATMKCARRIFEQSDNVKIITRRIAKLKKALAFYKKSGGGESGKSKNSSKNGFPPLDKVKAEKDSIKICSKVYKDKPDVALCARTVMGGISLARLLSNLRKDKVAPQLDTPDKRIARRTNDSHPEAQCRLDTYLAGALCDIGYEREVDQDNPFINACNRKEKHVVGIRPLCWFNPSDFSAVSLAKKRGALGALSSKEKNW